MTPEQLVSEIERIMNPHPFSLDDSECVCSARKALALAKQVVAWKENVVKEITRKRNDRSGWCEKDHTLQLESRRPYYPDVAEEILDDVLNILSEERKDGSKATLSNLRGQASQSGGETARFERRLPSIAGKPARKSSEGETATEQSVVERMGDAMYKQLSKVSLCPACSAMTHTIVRETAIGEYSAVCGKCGALKVKS